MSLSFGLSDNKSTTAYLPKEEQQVNDTFPASLKNLCINSIRRNLNLIPTEFPQQLLLEILSGVDSSKNGYWESRQKVISKEFGNGENEKELCRLLSEKQVLSSTKCQAGVISEIESHISTITSMPDALFSLSLNCLSSLEDVYLPNLTRLELQFTNKSVLGSAASNAGCGFFQGMHAKDIISLVKVLVKSPCLCSLALTNSQIDDDLIRLLMKKLDVVENGIENSKHLSIRNTLIELDISHNNISTEGIRILLNFFFPEEDGKDPSSRTTSVLQSFKLADNQIRAEACRSLGRVLGHSNSLIHVDLRMNYLFDSGGEFLFKGILSNKHRRSDLSLNLASNSLSSLSMAVLSGAIALAETNSTFGSLDLSNNLFNAQDIVNLAFSLKQHKCPSNFMKSLDLRGNNYRTYIEDGESSSDDCFLPPNEVKDALKIIEDSLMTNTRLLANQKNRILTE